MLLGEKAKKKVSFNEVVKVVLIPCIQDFRDADLFETMWWKAEDFKMFQIQMAELFKKYLEKTPCSDIKQGLRLFIEHEIANVDSDISQQAPVSPVAAAKQEVTLCSQMKPPSAPSAVSYKVGYKRSAAIAAVDMMPMDALPLVKKGRA
jgi:hypothetical protein